MANLLGLEHLNIQGIDAVLNFYSGPIFLVVIIVTLSFLIDLLLANSIIGRRYRIFVAPGVIIHEFSHAVFCILTGARIKKMALFEADGGYVEHTPPKIPIIGQALISFAPFVFGLGIIFILIKLIGIHGLNIPIDRITDLKVLSHMSASILNIFKSINFSSPKEIFFMYLILSICVTMTPSWQDLANAFISLILIFALIFGITKFSNFSFVLPIALLDKVNAVLSPVALILILCFLFSIIIYVISLPFKK